MRVCKYHSKTHSTLKRLPRKLRENILTGSRTTAFQSGSILSSIRSLWWSHKASTCFYCCKIGKSREKVSILHGVQDQSQRNIDFIFCWKDILEGVFQKLIFRKTSASITSTNFRKHGKTLYFENYNKTYCRKILTSWFGDLKNTLQSFYFWKTRTFFNKK